METVRGARVAVHWPLAVVLAVGIVVRVVSSYGLTPRQVVGLLTGVAVCVVLVRWGCWRWLGAVAALPIVLAVRPLASRPGDEVLGLLVLSVTLLALSVPPSRPGRARLWAAGAGLVVTVVLLALADPATDDRGPGSAGVVLLGLCALLGAAAAVGLGRSRPVPLRLACGVLVLAPLATVVVGPALRGLPVIAWWPAAGALGVTALLRGRRGRAAARPQTDEVDVGATVDFRRIYGVPSLGPVVIVIAAYNEAEGIPEVLRTLPTEVCGLSADVMVVDDGSSDGTGAALAETRAFIVGCAVNRGQGAALRLGYRLAREHGAAYVLTTDADGQYDVADLPKVLTPILEDRADFVTGSRVLGAQHTHDRVRRLGVHVFAWLATALTGRRLTDTSFGLRAMRAGVTGAVTLNQPQYQSSELLLGVLSHGFRVLEVPGTMRVRSAGTSKKGRNLVYGSRYARVMTGTWWREGCPQPVADGPGPGRWRGDVEE